MCFVLTTGINGCGQQWNVYITIPLEVHCMFVCMYAPFNCLQAQLSGSAGHT